MHIRIRFMKIQNADIKLKYDSVKNKVESAKTEKNYTYLVEMTVSERARGIFFAP